MHVTAGRRGVCAAFAALLLAASVASAQVGTARISGSVKDERGRALKGATVTATNDSIARSLTAATNDKGHFSILGLGFGTWTIRIEAPGFQAFTFNMPVRTMRENPPVDVRLMKRPDPAPPLLLRGADPSEVQRELDEAAALVDSGRTDAAIAAYRRVLGRHPALTSINLQLGYLFEMKEDLTAALAAYRAALAGDPSSAPAGAAIDRLTR